MRLRPWYDSDSAQGASLKDPAVERPFCALLRGWPEEVVCGRWMVAWSALALAELLATMRVASPRYQILYLPDRPHGPFGDVNRTTPQQKFRAHHG